MWAAAVKARPPLGALQVATASFLKSPCHVLYADPLAPSVCPGAYIKAKVMGSGSPEGVSTGPQTSPG